MISMLLLYIYISIVVFILNGIVGVLILANNIFDDFINKKFPQSGNGILSFIIVIELWPLVVIRYLLDLFLCPEFIVKVKEEIKDGWNTLRTLILGK